MDVVTCHIMLYCIMPYSIASWLPIVYILSFKVRSPCYELFSSLCTVFNSDPKVEVLQALGPANGQGMGMNI